MDWSAPRKLVLHVQELLLINQCLPILDCVVDYLHVT